VSQYKAEFGKGNAKKSQMFQAVDNRTALAFVNGYTALSEYDCLRLEDESGKEIPIESVDWTCKDKGTLKIAGFVF
jgi:hypothetical protein